MHVLLFMKEQHLLDRDEHTLSIRMSSMLKPLPILNLTGSVRIHRTNLASLITTYLEKVMLAGGQVYK